jgi:uncharacterized circularly permuted ATP-grasp superfamily protein
MTGFRPLAPRKRAEADMLFHRVGITFAVYGEEAGTERLIPFDIVPRIIPFLPTNGGSAECPST